MKHWKRGLREEFNELFNKDLKYVYYSQDLDGRMWKRERGKGKVKKLKNWKTENHIADISPSIEGKCFV